MDIKVIWSPRAASHLEDICAHISKDSTIYASVFAKKVLSTVKELSKYPQSGRIVPEYNQKNIREWIYSDYRIVYRVRSDSLEIAAICHTSRLIDRIEIIS